MVLANKKLTHYRGGECMFSKLTWYSEHYMEAEHLDIQTRSSGGGVGGGH